MLVNIITDIKIISPNYVGIVCECTVDGKHLRTYNLQELADKGFVCIECGNKTVAKAVKIDLGKMEYDAKTILKGVKEIQKHTTDLENARKLVKP